MKITPKKKLFWYLKEGVRLDLEEPSELDMYLQQVITRGGIEDVKDLLKKVDLRQFKTSFQRIQPFLPFEVEKFWEDFLGSH